MLLPVNAWPRHSVSRVKCKRNHKNASRSCHGHGTRTCEFVVGCGRHGNTPVSDGQASGWQVEDSEMEDSHNESKRARTIGGMEACVLDDRCEEWLDEPVQMLEDQEGSEQGDVDRRSVPAHIH